MVSLDHLHDADLDRKVCLECHRQFTGIVAACPHDNTMLVPVAQDPLIGTKLAGKYEIMSVLGTGGMGVVYKGRQDIMDRIVAIKMLQSHHLNDSMSVKRFQQEGKATCKLNHPHIITVYDFGIAQQTGQPYIVMDYLQGIALSEVIKQEGQIGVDRAVKIFQQAAEALGHAHKQGVVHRDLKPSNIVLINYDGDKDFVKVVDFGVAQLLDDNTGEGNQQRLTQMGEVCGSPVYMSPEQAQGHKLDNRSDVYSMGVVMYETLTNRLPLLGKTMVETMRKHIEETPPPFSQVRPDLYIPERVESIIMKAMAKSPDDRFPSMEHLAQELDLAIPKPGRSQVLRTTPLENQEAEAESAGEALSGLFLRMTLVHWVMVLAVTVTLGALTIVGIYTMFSKKPKAVPVTPTAITAPATETGGSANSTTPPAVPATTTPAATTPAPTATTPAPASTTPVPAATTPVPAATTPAPAATTPAPAATPPAPVAAAPVTPKAVVKRKPKPPRPSASTTSAAPKPAKPNSVWGDLIKQRSYKTGHSLEQ